MQLRSCYSNVVRHIGAMARAARKQIEGYSYADVEHALCTLFRVPTHAKGIFRGRIRHLQRVGLVEVAPGKGRRILYGRAQAIEWMLALLLAEFGVDPTVIVKSIQGERGQLRDWIVEATDEEALGGDEVFLRAGPALMSGAWASKHGAGVLRFEKFRRRDSEVPRQESHPPPSVRLAPQMTVPAAGSVAPPSPEVARPEGHHSFEARGIVTESPDVGAPELGVLDWADPLLLVINLTRPVRDLGAALDATPSE
jgi:hypothetical protein